MGYQRINKFGITRYFGGRKTFQKYGTSRRVLVANYKNRSAKNIMRIASTVNAQRAAGFKI